MNFNISAWSIRRPVPALVLFMVVMTLGLYSFSELPITRFPNIDVPVLQVQVTQAGAAPAELETQVTNKIEDAIARIRPDLPRTIDEPLVQRLEVEGLPILTYAARAPAMTAEELSWFVDDTVSRALQGIKGVSRVERVGGVTREIRVALDPDRLLAYGITAGEVNKQIRATNVDLAGGRGEIAGREQAIRTLAGAQSVADLAATMIPLPGVR